MSSSETDTSDDNQLTTTFVVKNSCTIVTVKCAMVFSH